jgi:hypothetical protein
VRNERGALHEERGSAITSAAGGSGFYEVEYRVDPPAFARRLQVRGRVVRSGAALRFNGCPGQRG